MLKTTQIWHNHPLIIVHGFFLKIGLFWPDEKTQTKHIVWKALQRAIERSF